ncbi:MAG TPA: transcriptional repressor LexA [Blastocatellia bacterium]|nr:transcriptional repressor LexA [Blastocatellia bacterium]
MSLTPRQLEVHDFLTRFQQKHGYAPTIAEIQKHFQLNSPATVHEQLAVLERRGLIRRQKHVQRGIEILQSSVPAGEYEIPLLGVVAAGLPIEAILTRETISVSPDIYAPDRFALRVRGDSMRDEQIADGDLIIIEPAQTARNGQTVVALIDEHEATVKKFYNERNQIRLQPANENYQPIIIKPLQRVKVQGLVVGLIRRYR